MSRVLRLVALLAFAAIAASAHAQPYPEQADQVRRAVPCGR